VVSGNGHYKADYAMSATPLVTFKAVSRILFDAKKPLSVKKSECKEKVEM
jgi:hypothetical protein